MFCRILFWIFASAWAIALGLYAMGAHRDPLAGVFLIPLGFPWVYALTGLPAMFDAAKPFLAAAMPGVNLAMIGYACHLRKKRRAAGPQP